MSKFTPGPWKVVPCNDQWGIEAEVTICGHVGRAIIISGLTEANARLIAAAPDLLEALESAISMLNTKELDGSDIQELDRIDRVIAKATKGDE